MDDFQNPVVTVVGADIVNDGTIKNVELPEGFSEEWEEANFVKVATDEMAVGARIHLSGEVARKGAYFNFDLSGNGGYYIVDGSNLVLDVDKGENVELWATYTGKKDPDTLLPIIAGVKGRVVE